MTLRDEVAIRVLGILIGQRDPSATTGAETHVHRATTIRRAFQWADDYLLQRAVSLDEHQPPALHIVPTSDPASAPFNCVDGYQSHLFRGQGACTRCHKPKPTRQQYRQRVAQIESRETPTALAG